MKRTNMKPALVGIAVLLTFFTLLFIFSRKSHQPKVADAAEPTPTPESTQTAPTSLVNESEPLSTEDSPEPTQAKVTISCDMVKNDIQSLAREFMTAHQNKQAETVLGLISTPYTQDDQDQLDYWLGLDNQNQFRLYKTPETSYAVSTYSLGKILDRGQDLDERGSKRCQLAVTEVRAVTTTVPYSEQTVSRYVDFAVDISNFVTLTAYRDSKDGKKYGGFNN